MHPEVRAVGRRGIITMATSVIPMYDATNGVISVEVVTSTTGIGQ